MVLPSESARCSKRPMLDAACFSKVLLHCFAHVLWSERGPLAELCVAHAELATADIRIVAGSRAHGLRQTRCFLLRALSSSRFSAAYLVLPRLPAVPLHILYWAGETGEGVTWEGAHGSNKGRNCRRRRDQSICGGGGSRGSEWAAECTSQLEKRQSARVPRILREEPTWYCKHQSMIGGFTT
jgi:hypothetical protein